MCRNYRKTNINFKENHLVYHDRYNDRFANPDELQALENVGKMNYEENIKKANAMIAGVLHRELNRSAGESLIFNPNEDNSSFVNENDEPTLLLQKIIAKSAEETLTQVRTRIKTAEDLKRRFEEDEVYQGTLEWGLINNLQALINRSKTELLLVEGGYCSMMEGFINCNSKFGKDLYGQVTQQAFEKMQKTRMPASMLFMDLDNFKAVNDQYGHDVGDEALKETADLVTNALRARNSDKRMRFGGEEVGVLMESTTAMQAVIPAERIRKTLEDNPLFLRQHVELAREEGGEDKKSAAASIQIKRFKELIKKNGIKEIEIGDDIQIPKDLQDLLRDKPMKVVKGGRGIKFVLPDERDSNSHIVLLNIPITASIGISEYSPEMMEQTSASIAEIENAENIPALRNLLISADITEKSGVLTKEDKALMIALMESENIQELKQHMKINGLEESVLMTHIKSQIRGIFIKRSFEELRSQADQQMYMAKKGGRNCTSVEGLMINPEDIDAIGDAAIEDKDRPTLSPPPIK